MCEHVAGMDPTIKVRGPLKSALLDLVTLGIYGFYWFYVTNRDLAALGRKRGTTELGENPTHSLLAAFPGFLIVVPFVISGYNTAERVNAARRGSSLAADVSSVAATIAMVVFFPVAIYYLQKRLNPVWERETA